MVEAHPELDERREPAVDRYLPLVRAVDAGKALEKRALAAAVLAHDAEELARLNIEGDAAERIETLVGPRGERMDEALPDRRVVLVRETEGLAQEVCRDRGRGGKTPGGLHLPRGRDQGAQVTSGRDVRKGRPLQFVQRLAGGAFARADRSAM